jgi:mono/diheme cytochrome c family protein
MATSLNNEMLLQSVSKQFFRKSILNGRSGSRVMPAFTFENAGLFEEEVDAVIDFMGQWRDEHDIAVQENLDLDNSRIAGNAENGRAIFHRSESCSKCHGDNGTGGEKAPQLNGQDFLELATDSYIRATILSNRMKIPNRPTADEINDVVAYMRSWQR